MKTMIAFSLLMLVGGCVSEYEGQGIRVRGEAIQYGPRRYVRIGNYWYPAVERVIPIDVDPIPPRREPPPPIREERPRPPPPPPPVRQDYYRYDYHFHLEVPTPKAAPPPKEKEDTPPCPDHVHFELIHT